MYTSRNIITLSLSFLSLPFHPHSGIVGSGLCVFSRHPIMAAHVHQFSLTGGVRDIADGEVFAGKGILLTRLKTSMGAVAFYNTHVREMSMFKIDHFMR